MTLRRFTYGFTLAFLYVAIVLTVLGLFFARLLVHNERMSLPNLLDGSAHRPYAYRVLVPETVRLAARAGRAMLGVVGFPAGATPVGKLGARVLEEIGAPDQVARYSFEYGLYLLLVACCFLGTGLLLRSLTRRLYPGVPGFVADLGPVLGIALLPWLFFRFGNQVYDPMTLFLTTACVYLIAVRAHAAYLVAFALAALNKETAVLLAAVFVAREWGVSSRARLGILSALQLAVFALIRVLLTQAMRDRQGTVVEFHLDYNLQVFGDATFYMKTLISVLPMALLAGFGWRSKPVFLRRGLVAIGVPLFFVTLFMGVFGELRALYELYPFVFLLSIPTLVDVFRMDPGDA